MEADNGPPNLSDFSEIPNMNPKYLRHKPQKIHSDRKNLLSYGRSKSKVGGALFRHVHLFSKIQQHQTEADQP